MFVAIVMQSVALVVTLVVGVCVVYAIAQMRRAYTEQLDDLPRAISAVEEFQKNQQEFNSFLRRIESDGRALQKITLQLEVAVADLKETVSASMRAATERHTAAVENIRDYIDTQEDRLAKLLESLSETLQSIPQPQQSTERPRTQNGDHSRFRREVLSQDPELRFSVLKEWISVNALAIQHRASRHWNSARDLIATIPPYLEPLAEVLNDSVLLVGTRGHSEVLAVLLRQLDSSSEFSQWFSPASNGKKPHHVPAVLARSNGHFKLLAKGTNSATGLPAA
jgi:hypothetical protein